MSRYIDDLATGQTAKDKMNGATRCRSRPFLYAVPGSVDPKRLIVVVIAASVVVAATIVFVTIVATVAVTVVGVLISVTILTLRMMVAVTAAITGFAIDVALETREIALDHIGFLATQPAIRST